MTQTVKGNNNTQPPKPGQTTPLRQRRPGQRQQERLMRQQRRRRRQLIWTSSIVAVVLVAVVGLSFWQFQRIQTEQANAKAAAKATATAKVKAAASATAKAEITPTPSAGPATPPPVTGTTVTLPDGLKYIDVKVGSGTAAKSGSTISAQYTGWLASNNKKFDSSYDHGGQPFSVTLGQGQVIPGWDEGVVGMKPGGVRRLIIPPSLGYGASGQPPTIPANATLIFDVTMVSVK